MKFLINKFHFKKFSPGIWILGCIGKKQYQGRESLAVGIIYGFVFILFGEYMGKQGKFIETISHFRCFSCFCDLQISKALLENKRPFQGRRKDSSCTGQTCLSRVHGYSQVFTFVFPRGHFPVPTDYLVILRAFQD